MNKPAVKADLDPVALQYERQDAEDLTLSEEDTDPIGDDVHSPVKGIVHRYPDRVLLKISNICAVYCRYCFRKEMIGPGSDGLRRDDTEKALDYIRHTPEIWEVILTGGDPLILSPEKLGRVLDALEEIEHVKIIRIHTRVPLHRPDMITQEMARVLTREKPVYIAVHVNHVQELTQDVRTALKTLDGTGAVLLSQSVLLRGVNDNAQVLEDLFRALVGLKVKPYYLHHPDMVPGTAHFRLSIAEGQEIVRQLLGRVSGLCRPAYMLDIPGGYGKIPLESCYVEDLQNGTYGVRDYKGCTHSYPPQKTTPQKQPKRFRHE